MKPRSSDSPLILAVDESAERVQLLDDALRAAGFTQIHLLNETTDLLEKVVARGPDVILMEVDSPRRDELEQLSLVRDRHPTAVLMIAQDPEAFRSMVGSRAEVEALQPGDSYEF